MYLIVRQLALCSTRKFICTALLSFRRKDFPMSRKDFRLIAETIRLLPSSETFERDGARCPTDVVNFDCICLRFAEALRPTNPRFNRERFVAACYGKGR